MIWFPGILLAVVLTVGFIILRPTFQRRCPHCRQKDSVERVRRSTLLKAFLVWLPHKAYHCYACRRHFLRIG